MYDIFDCKLVNFVQFKNNKLVEITQDTHLDMYKLTITPKVIKWREFEEFTNYIDNSKTKFNIADTYIKTKTSVDTTNTFTMYKYKNQGLYSIVTEGNNKSSIHNFDCVKSTEFKEKDKQEWYKSDK